jgi:hypothetical protein
MSKQFRGITCVYCASAPSTPTGDHVFARKFFTSARRANLPKVPACKSCNDEKSRLEHYLMGVLPFGGRHSDAIQNLTELLPPRLESNAKLHQQLRSGQQRAWAREGGLIVPALTLPIEGDKVAELFRFITKGLLWHHWQVRFDPAKTGVWTGFLNARGVEAHRSFLAMRGNAKVSEDLGKGTLAYEGSQGTDFPEMSIWLFSLYGGIKLSGDPATPQDECSLLGAVTATIPALQKFVFLLNPESA